MAMFNSYVSLPEGIQIEMDVGLSLKQGVLQSHALYIRKSPVSFSNANSNEIGIS